MNKTTQQLTNKVRKCFAFYRMKDESLENLLLSTIYVSIMPFIIGANLLLIFGIIKTNRNKFTSSQVLFLTLFSSDLAVGVVQLPMVLYLIWKPSYPTCFEIQLVRFLIVLPICMSGTTIAAISIERYINVVYNKYHKTFVTNKSLAVIIFMVTFISTMWALINALYYIEHERTPAKVFISTSLYTGILPAIGVILNMSLLRNAKQKIQNSTIQQSIDSTLTKTIAIIVRALVIAILPVLVVFSIKAYMFLNFTDRQLIHKRGRAFPWILILPQINAVVNSVIYFARNSRMKHYYYKLFQGRQKNKDLKNQVPPVPQFTTKNQRLDFI